MNNQTESVKAVPLAVEQPSTGLAKIIEDPFASALAATAATALAVGVVLSGMWVISLSV